MIRLKTEEEIQGMKRAGEVIAKMHLAVHEIVRPGLTTAQVDQFAEAFMRMKGAIPEQIGYEGYPYATCTSVNDVICHGFPSDDLVLKEGDILSLDTVVNLDGYLADSCWSYPIGTLSEKDQALYDTTLECLYRGIEQAKAGNRIGDIGHAIQTYAEKRGFSVVRSFVGHGIGKEMHEDPQVPHYGVKGRGVRLRENMVLTIEPMINEGRYQVTIDDDGWTARTIDGKKSCQFEHTMAIRKDGAELLTDQDETSLTDEEKAWIESYKW